MENKEFCWKQGELLTKQRLDDFATFLRMGSGLLHRYQAGNYGFGYARSQTIGFRYNDDLRVTVMLPSFHIVFPNGYLYFLDNAKELSIEYRPDSLLCLSLGTDNPKRPGLCYFPGPREAYTGNCLPLIIPSPDLNGQPDTYLRPVLDIRSADIYTTHCDHLQQLAEKCEQRIAGYFINPGIAGVSSLDILKNLVLQVFLQELISLKTAFCDTKAGMLPPVSMGSVQFFSLFKKLLVTAECFAPYFNEIERLGGGRQSFNEREAAFSNRLRQLLAHADGIHFHENILLLSKWMEGLSNVLDALCSLQDGSSAVFPASKPQTVPLSKPTSTSWV